MPFYFGYHRKSYCIFDQDLHLFYHEELYVSSALLPQSRSHCQFRKKTKSKKGKFLFQDNIQIVAKKSSQKHEFTSMYTDEINADTSFSSHI